MHHFLPQWVVDELKLRRLKRIFPQAAYIRSPDVSVKAQLGDQVGIGKDVVVNATVSIGAYSYVNRGAFIFSGSVGRFCSIAHRVQIGAEQHPKDFLSTSPRIYGDDGITGVSTGFAEIYSPPVIGSDVWIGSAAMIMQGTSIGHGAIVAAGAVVTKDVPPYSIVAGVPARVIGYRFDANVRTELLRRAWWQLEGEDLKGLAELVQARQNFACYFSGLPPTKGKDNALF